MDILLDTNVLIYAMVNDRRLGESARTIVTDAGNTCYFSAVSVWEVVLKHGVNPSNLPIDGLRFLSNCKRSGAIELPMTAHHAAMSAEVVDMGHNDPFDRMLIAQAKLRGCMLMTCDKVLISYGLPMLIDGRV